MRKTIFILLFALLGILSAHAYDFEVDGIYYIHIPNTDHQVAVTHRGDYNSYSGSVVIPSTVVYNDDIYTITFIGAEAFSKCTGLTSVMIPEGVTDIGEDAFLGCRGLSSVTIPESVSTIWGHGAFYGCSSISNPLYNSKIFVYMPQSYSGEYAIPSGIQTITDYAFVECSGLTSVTIPESVTYIGEGAFYGCSGLSSVAIPNSVASIEFRTFYNCSSLTSVTIPESVTSIGGEAFYGCSGLTSVTIPNSVTSIGSSAFEDCTGLTSVTIPESVDTIGFRAFDRCDNLISVISLAKNPPYCDYLAFRGVYSATLLVPRGSKAVYQTAEEWREFTRIYEFGFDGTGWVTAQANDTVMGRVTGGGEYEIDEEIMIEAIPNEGYYFVRWDDGDTDNPRQLTVAYDITLTAIFAKEGEYPTANEAPEADKFRVYAQNRTIYLSEDKGLVQVYNMAGQCVYNGHATAIPVQLGGVYILVSNGKRIKVAVR